jgi:hypothetical protein
MTLCGLVLSARHIDAAIVGGAIDVSAICQKRAAPSAVSTKGFAGSALAFDVMKISAELYGPKIGAERLLGAVQDSLHQTPSKRSPRQPARSLPIARLLIGRGKQQPNTELSRKYELRHFLGGPLRAISCAGQNA